MFLLLFRTAFEVLKLLTVCFVMFKKTPRINLKKISVIIGILVVEGLTARFFSISILFALIIAVILIGGKNVLWVSFYSHILVQVIDNMSAVALESMVDNIGRSYKNVSNLLEREAVELVIILVFCLLIRMLLGKERTELPQMHLKEYISLFLTGVLMFFMSGTSRMIIDGILTPKVEKIFILTDFFIMIVLLSVFYFQNFLYYSRNQYKKQYELLEALNRERESFIEEQSRQYNDSIKFRHDMEHYISVMKSQALEHDNKELENYSNEIEGYIDESFHKIDCGNTIISYILADYYRKSGQEEIDLSWDGHIYNDMVLSRIELSALFGNLMKNAYEACLKCGNGRFIKAAFLVYANDILIRVSNSTVKDNTDDATKLGTDKADKKLHGQGIKEIKNLCEKYSGMSYSAKIKDGIYVAEIIIPGKR